MIYKLNKHLILEDFSDVQEEMRKRQKMGQEPMTADEKHEALLRSMNKHVGDKAQTNATNGLRKSVNSNDNSDMGGAINASQAAEMKRKLAASGF